jgi:hypothetical protein
MRKAAAGHLLSRSNSINTTGGRLKIERLTSRSEGSGWKSTWLGNSLAAYLTSCTVLKPSRDGDIPA